METPWFPTQPCLTGGWELKKKEKQTWILKGAGWVLESYSARLLAAFSWS